MKIWVDLILCYRKNAGPTNLQRSENNNQIDPSKAKQDERTPEKNKSFVEETRNTKGGVLYLGGEDVISLFYALEYLLNFAYYCISLSEGSRPRPHPRHHPVAHKG